MAEDFRYLDSNYNPESNLQEAFADISARYFPVTKRRSSVELGGYHNEDKVFTKIFDEVNNILREYSQCAYDWRYRIEIPCVKEGELNVISSIVTDSIDNKEKKYIIGTGTDRMTALRSAVTTLSTTPISGIPNHLRDIGFDNRPSLDGLRNAVNLLVDRVKKGFRKSK
jgi:hypothetical protein